MKSLPFLLFQMVDYIKLVICKLHSFPIRRLTEDLNNCKCKSYYQYLMPCGWCYTLSVVYQTEEMWRLFKHGTINDIAMLGCEWSNKTNSWNWQNIRSLEKYLMILCRLFYETKYTWTLNICYWPETNIYI